MTKKVLGIVFLCAVLVSCGGGGGGSSSSQGTLVVSITDAPASDFQQINVTISAVRVHMSANAGTGDAGWHDLTLANPVRINLLSLQNGILQTLGQMSLDSGHYQQIRLLLVPNSGGLPPFNDSVVPATGPNAGMEMPLNIQPEDVNGIKIVQQFTVNEGKVADLVLDFDGKNSVILKGDGTYMLQPVITATVTERAPSP